MSESARARISPVRCARQMARTSLAALCFSGVRLLLLVLLHRLVKGEKCGVIWRLARGATIARFLGRLGFFRLHHPLALLLDTVASRSFLCREHLERRLRGELPRDRFRCAGLRSEDLAVESDQSGIGRLDEGVGGRVGRLGDSRSGVCKIRDPAESAKVSMREKRGTKEGKSCFRERCVQPRLAFQIKNREYGSRESDSLTCGMMSA